jgi:hypothetical protein
MSFNPNDNNLHPISRTNYEEHFLLYADNELSPVEKAAVLEFVKAHPDLQQELDLLLQTKLPIENFSLENKEALFANSMKLNSIDENLLLYIDDELSENEKKAVEQKLKADKAFQLQYADLLKTKPEAPATIVYPYKKELYRYEKRKSFPVYWMRIAAAVVIILSMGIFVFTYQSKQDIVVAEGTKKIQPVKEAKTPNETKTEVAINNENTNAVKPTVAKTGETDDVPNVVRNLGKKKQQQLIKKEAVVIFPTENEVPVIAKKEEKEPGENSMAVTKKTEVSPQQNLNNPTVTPPSVASLNNQTTTSPVAAVQSDVVKIDNDKKSSLKGILRKATRFIERRTNISTTNEDNELLIGAVALKL